MIIDDKNKQILMEARDINFILPRYIANYLFGMKNEDPVRIVFPMFPAAPHPVKPGVLVPIQWISPTDPLAKFIAEDGGDVPEVTPEQEAELDTKDKVVEELKEQVEEPPTTPIEQEEGEEVGGSTEEQPAVTPKIKQDDKEPVSKAKAAFARVKIEKARVPKMPSGGDLGSGHPDNLGTRDTRLEGQMKSDLKDDVDVKEEEELPAEIEKPKKQS